jgi:hypothetical protein
MFNLNVGRQIELEMRFTCFHGNPGHPVFISAGGFTGMKYEIKPLGGDILILLGQTFLNDVTE